jgi:hypothetical protein
MIMGKLAGLDIECCCGRHINRLSEDERSPRTETALNGRLECLSVLKGDASASTLYEDGPRAHGILNHASIDISGPLDHAMAAGSQWANCCS